MSYPRILAKVFNSPWAIHQPMLGSILTTLGTRLAREQAEAMAVSDQSLPANAREGSAFYRGQKRDAGVQRQRWAVDRWGALVDFEAQAHTAGMRAYYAQSSYTAAYEAELATAPAGQTLVIFGSGILGKHLDSMEEMCAGGLSVDKIQAALCAGRDDEKVASIVTYLDSPGGILYGIPETAALVREISTTKPIVAFCDSMSASAAYWIAAACDHVYVTPSADLGSIGVYSAYFDQSGQFAKEGVKVELFKDGIYKAAGFPGTSLTDEQRAKILEEVMQCSAQFKDFIRAQRTGIKDDAMQGQCFIGQAAVTAKLADSLVNSLEDVLRDLAAPAA